jgi:hypothetical protein
MRTMCIHAELSVLSSRFQKPHFMSSLKTLGKNKTQKTLSKLRLGSNIGLSNLISNNYHVYITRHFKIRM